MKAFACAVLGSLAIGSVSALYGADIVPAGRRGYTVYLTNAPGGTPRCGAVMLNEYTVLTAASCTDYYPIYVTVGTQRSRATNSNQVRAVTRTRIHPNYDRSTGAFGIAVLKLNETSNTPTIRIPPTSDSSRTVKSNASVQLLGWGSTNLDNNRAISERLRSLDMRVVEAEECRKRTGLSFIDRNFMCASGGKRSGAALYDIGNPLVLSNGPGDGNDIVVGVCLNPMQYDVPTVFARTSALRDFLVQNM